MIISLGISDFAFRPYNIGYYLRRHWQRQKSRNCILISQILIASFQKIYTLGEGGYYLLDSRLPFFTTKISETHAGPRCLFISNWRFTNNSRIRNPPPSPPSNPIGGTTSTKNSDWYRIFTQLRPSSTCTQHVFCALSTLGHEFGKAEYLFLREGQRTHDLYLVSIKVSECCLHILQKQHHCDVSYLCSAW